MVRNLRDSNIIPKQIVIYFGMVFAV